MSVLIAVGLGLVAGVVGTIAMTASEAVEMRVTSRQPSMVPGQVGTKLLARSGDPRSPKRFNAPVHWAHGITLGAVRGLLGVTALGPALATVVHYGLVWGGDVLLYRSLGIAPWPWQWKSQELVTDLFHKGVYAIVTGVTFEVLWAAVN